jgi:glycosyltransferase involved in cell wall biosynthesis
MTEPKLTVLMAVYNGERFLPKAVQSILDQTFTDFEFLVIDDGSTDRSASILESYNDPRIRVIENIENIGLTRSLNKGIRLARGEYIARMDADDISLPERLEQQVEYLDAHTDAGLVMCQYEAIDETGAIFATSHAPATSEAIYYQLTFFCLLLHGCAMFRKELILELNGYDESLVRAQDVDLWYRMSRHTRIGMIDKVLLQYRYSATNISSLFKTEQDYSCHMIFVKSIKTLMHNDVSIEDVQCFEDEGFGERRPLVIKYASVCGLLKIQERLVAECPSWLNRRQLETYCKEKLQQYIGIMISNAQLVDVIRLLHYPRCRTAFFNILNRKATSLWRGHSQ